MNILAIDSANEILSLALAAGKGIWYLEIDQGPRHSELMMECIDVLCKKADLPPKDLNLVACMKGPGSFTGLRIGFSTAKGLSVATGAPLVSIPTLDCLAYRLSMWPGIVIPAIDSKKGCFFTALYYNGKCLTSYLDITPEDIVSEIGNTRPEKPLPVLLTGPGAALLKSRIETLFSPELIRLDPGYRTGSARELLEISRNVIIIQNNENYNGPLYIRKSDAELNIG